MPNDGRQPASVHEVVEHGLCIGCGLCEALGPDRWKMTMTAEGRLRPAPLGPEDPAADAAILAACPGTVAEATADGPKEDDVWGRYVHMGEAWAGDPEIRFRAATGGVLTALGMHLLKSGKARFILHCSADPAHPVRSRWVMSETPEEVARRSGSRYGPSDTLAGLEAALARGEPFAIIAKPCDAGAVRARAKADPRLEKLLVAVLVMVCGGASDLGKSWMLLDELGVAEEEVTVFRYRGYGNPGRARVETSDGRAYERTYDELWGDEAGWRIQTRCKLCPDAIGEAADIAAADIWPDAQPEGEDAGFNGVITRTSTGQRLMQAAVEAGDLTLGKEHTPRDYDHFQPHQVNKKRAMAARLRGLSRAGWPVYSHKGLRLDTLDAGDDAEEQGAHDRALSGRFSEKLPRP
ncbi:Coenzyme F420 hydrogenase/dehydrogenase, beta subunit C-terminal domain [Roseovarius sp.]|uniref:Coenzyme F420 hydrogenase/dehydrogenase, beta subunit C-terminal domain n=1 Tax=Roseovarius sp. TaxID=1486281 RepID=UPI0026263CE3|nr:Coenzyme F420 hydrogenase/dehydrogenase, beta subunit C-terminal domain [Roseovarius sp.]MDM8165238.1 Coenzyme F420 hydrogenase/dehydrogenase, beta subunit C-terminal domain [Roseovarius sp.]